MGGFALAASLAKPTIQSLDWPPAPVLWQRHCFSHLTYLSFCPPNTPTRHEADRNRVRCLVGCLGDIRLLSIKVALLCTQSTRESQREPEGARGSQREPEGARERTRGSQREPDGKLSLGKYKVITNPTLLDLYEYMVRTNEGDDMSTYMRCLAHSSFVDLTEPDF